MFNEKKLSGQQPELQFLIKDLHAPMNREPGSESFYESSVSLDCFNLGLAIVSHNMEVLVANAAFCNLSCAAPGQVVNSNLYGILGLKSHAIFAIRSILESDNSWSGKILIDNQALRVDINRIDPSFVIAGRNDIAAFAVTLQDYAAEYRKLQQIADARSQAEKTDRAKSQFLSHMSHELRTPLNAILGFSQLLNLDPDLTEMQRDNVQEIESAGQFLLTLINEILDLSRIEAGKIQLCEDDIDLKYLVDECFALVKPLAESKGVKLDCHLEPGCHIRNDHVRLKQVLINLLSNAIKYNIPGGKVALLCHRARAGSMRIEVVDSGRGMDQSQLSSLFSPFERLDADKRNIEGTGIGLMIARRLVKLMRGDLGVISSKGTGSLFWMDLPEQLQEAADAFGNDAPLSRPWNHPCAVYWCGPRLPELSIVEMLQSVRPEMHLASGSTASELLRWSTHNPRAIVFLTESMLADAAHDAALNNTLKQNPLVVVTRERGSVSPAQLAGLQPDAMVGQGCKLTDFLPLLTTYNLTDKGTSDAI